MVSLSIFLRISYQKICQKISQAGEDKNLNRRSGLEKLLAGVGEVAEILVGKRVLA